MKLTLRRMDDAHRDEARAIDGGAAFSVGTEHGATWVLADAGAAARIDIRRGPDGFLADASGAVSVEGQTVPDGVTIALSHGARVTLGGATLRASIAQGESSAFPGTHANPAAPTISSILSDISAGGDSASGVLPGAAGETWLESVIGPQRPPREEDAGPMRGFGHGPADERRADPQDEASRTPFLPDDWNEPGDKVNRMMQSESDSVALSVGKAARDEAKPATGAARRADSAGLLAAAGVSSIEVAGPPSRHFENAGAALKAALDGIGRLEQAMVRLQAEAGLPQRGAADQTTLNPAVVLSDESDVCLRYLAWRIAALETAQTALVRGALAQIARIREALDPAAIDAEVARTGGLKNRIAPAAAAWAEYRSRWSDGGPLDALLSEKGLARAIDAALSQEAPKEFVP